MRRHNNILFIVLTIGLFACGSSATNRQTVANDQPVFDDSTSLTKTQNINADSTIADNNFEPHNDCVRGQAEPIIKKDIFPNTTFVLQSDSITAVETVMLENGDKLIIRNWGCEYYVLTFRFETSRLKADTSDMKYWYVNSVKLMNEVKHGIDAPIDIEKGIEALNKHISGNVFDLQLHTQVDFGLNEVRNFVTLDSISKIDKNHFAITISFSIGPL